MCFTRALVSPPGRDFARGLTTSPLGPPDHAAALTQHDQYCAALAACGLEVIRLPADPGFPDATFVEDTAVITPRGAVLARPGAPSRLGESERISKALSPIFPELARIDPPGTLDGGDVCQAEDRFFIGLSERTNAYGARQLSDWLNALGYTSSLVDVRRLPGLLHLKTGMTYLGDGRLLVIDALAGLPEFRGYERVRVPTGEEYAANCVRVNEWILVPRGYPAVESVLREIGYRIIPLGMSEFHKMDGGLSCLSLRY